MRKRESTYAYGQHSVVGGEGGVRAGARAGLRDCRRAVLRVVACVEQERGRRGHACRRRLHARRRRGRGRRRERHRLAQARLAQRALAQARLLLHYTATMIMKQCVLTNSKYKV